MRPTGKKYGLAVDATTDFAPFSRRLSAYQKMLASR